MALAQSKTSWANYTAFVKTLARVDISFEWLAFFFSQRGQSLGGKLNMLESHRDILKEHACSLDDLGIPPKPENTRIVVFSYEEAWGLDRELLDKVALALNLPPYFL